MKKGETSINVSDVIGKRLGKLKVVGYAGHRYDNTKGGERMRHLYICECDCGATKVVRRGQILNNIIHSCGCSMKRTGNHK